jgi:FkbM family methyltransferase
MTWRDSARRRFPWLVDLKRVFYPIAEEQIRRVIARQFGPDAEVFFVQVGSNDGTSGGDPIFEFASNRVRWRGILIEPNPKVFQRLKANYRSDPRFIYENVAVARQPSSHPFYYVPDDPSLPSWFDEVSSFDRRHLKRHGIPDELIAETTVPCATLSALFAKHRVTKVDILHVDTEGYDAEVIKMIDFARFKPKIIIFEHTHLSREDVIVMERLLASHGYTHSRTFRDTIAVS